MKNRPVKARTELPQISSIPYIRKRQPFSWSATGIAEFGLNHAPHLTNSAN
jgi:hypothetical protein